MPGLFFWSLNEHILNSFFRDFRVCFRQLNTDKLSPGFAPASKVPPLMPTLLLVAAPVVEKPPRMNRFALLAESCASSINSLLPLTDPALCAPKMRRLPVLLIAALPVR